LPDLFFTVSLIEIASSSTTTSTAKKPPCGTHPAPLGREGVEQLECLSCLAKDGGGKQQKEGDFYDDNSGTTSTSPRQEERKEKEIRMSCTTTTTTTTPTKGIPNWQKGLRDERANSNEPFSLFVPPIERKQNVEFERARELRDMLGEKGVYYSRAKGAGGRHIIETQKKMGCCEGARWI
jgi:hypothetical protein